MRLRNSHAVHFWIWFTIFLTVMLSGSLGNYLKSYFTPFDINELEDGQLLAFKHNFGQTNFVLKLHSLRERGGTDVLLIGNHMSRAVYDDRGDDALDAFNVVYGNPSVLGSLDLLMFLEKENLLPRRALVLTLLTHQDQATVLDSGFDISPDLPWSRPYEWALRIPTMLEMEYVLSGHAALWSSPSLFDYPRCLAIRDGQIALPPDTARSLRMQIARFLPIVASNSVGLVSKDEICSQSRMFRDIDFDSFNRFGGYMAQRPPPDLSLHTPYESPQRTEAETAAAVAEFQEQIRTLTAFGRAHEFEVIYLFPPRHEVPIDGPLDEVANRAFMGLTGVSIVDFRRLSLEAEYFYDNTHVAASMNRSIFECVERILDASERLEYRSAFDGAGVTVC